MTDDGFALLRAASSHDRPAFDARRAAVCVIDMIAWQIPTTSVPGTLATKYYIDRVNDVVLPDMQRF
jgi:hypothetical protein